MSSFRKWKQRWKILPVSLLRETVKKNSQEGVALLFSTETKRLFLIDLGS